MEIKEVSDTRSRTNSSILIFIVSLLLLASIGLSVIGLLNGKNKDKENDNQESAEIQEEIPEESLTELFQKKFSENSGSGQDSFNDPFRKFCLQAEGEDNQAISSYTVCFR